jgi:hypothetical protein
MNQASLSISLMAEIDYLTKPNIITPTPLNLFGFNIHNVLEEDNSDSSKSLPRNQSPESAPP